MNAESTYFVAEKGRGQFYDPDIFNAWAKRMNWSLHGSGCNGQEKFIYMGPCIVNRI